MKIMVKIMKKNMIMKLLKLYLLEIVKEDDEELIKEQLENEKVTFENKIEMKNQINNGYESPDEEKVKQECENIEINTIKDITDDTNDNTVEELNMIMLIIINPE